MTVEIRQTAFDPYAELSAYQRRLNQDGKFGATVNFVGTVRDFNDGAQVGAMTLEHYPGMTEKHLRRISEEAAGRWDILEPLIIHRVGALAPGDPVVLLAVWAAHRGAAFEACRYLIEELKTRAPFWKKEQGEKSSRWVERNSSGTP